MKHSADYSLYLVTDSQLMSSKTIEQCVEDAILGGCTLVQLREKTMPSLQFYNTAQNLRKITAKHSVSFIINDRVDIALAVNADGVHVGQDDLPADKVRQLIGNNKILGVSASNLAQAQAAVQNGANYIGVGAMFATGTKTDANLVSMNELAKIRQQINLPIVVIGGINKNTVPLFNGTGINGLAVVSAIVAQPNVQDAAREIKALFLQTGIKT